MKKNDLTLSILCFFCFLVAITIGIIIFPYLKIVFTQLNN